MIASAAGPRRAALVVVAGVLLAGCCSTTVAGSVRPAATGGPTAPAATGSPTTAATPRPAPRPTTGPTPAADGEIDVARENLQAGVARVAAQRGVRARPTGRGLRRRRIGPARATAGRLPGRDRADRHGVGVPRRVVRRRPRPARDQPARRRRGRPAERGPPSPVTRAVRAPWRRTTAIPTDGWPEGTYLLRFDAADGARSYAPVTLRSTGSRGRLALVQDTLTWAAYNGWGGADLYGDEDDRLLPGGSFAVSFDRPYDGGGVGNFVALDLPAIARAERLGLRLAYLTNVDVAAEPALVGGARGLVSMGHRRVLDRRPARDVREGPGRGVEPGVPRREHRLLAGAAGWLAAGCQPGRRRLKWPATRRRPDDDGAVAGLARPASGGGAHRPADQD